MKRSDDTAGTSSAWPALDYAEWAPTKKTLHLCTQMIGKTRLAMAPPQPEWIHACLFLSPRGFTTGPIAREGHVVSAGVDVYESALWLRKGPEKLSVPIGPDTSIAEIWAGYQKALNSAGLELGLWEKPQEVPDTTPFSENEHDHTFVPEQAQRFHTLLCTVQSVFEEARSQFFARTGIQFWWGSFDLAFLLFTGKKEVTPEDRGYIMQYDLDAEHMNAGFWAGDDTAPEAGFYGYLVPQPEGCATAPVEPEYAGWVESLGEWMMPYESVRTCPDPRGALHSFLTSVYRVACAQGGWDAEQFVYEAPPPSKRGESEPTESGYASM